MDIILKRLKELSTKKELERKIFLLLIVIIGFVCRVYLFPVSSGDQKNFLEPWYELIMKNGRFKAVGMNIGDYMPTYYYLLALATYLPFSPMVNVKIISCIADLILSLFVMKIVFKLSGSNNRSVFAFACTFMLPTVILNSSAWGQCDAIFSSFLLASVYYLIKDKDFLAVACFTGAFVFKLQAIFLAPFLLLFLLKGRIRFRALLAFPIVFIASTIPALLTGANFLTLSTVYFRQAKQYSLLNMMIPNIWSFAMEYTSEPASKAGVLLAGAVVMIFLYYFYSNKLLDSKKNILVLAAFFTLLVPYLLPHMHERYYFIANILCIAVAFVDLRLFFVPLIMEFASVQVILNNLFGRTPMDMRILLIPITFVLIVLFMNVKLDMTEKIHSKQSD